MLLTLASRFLLASLAALAPPVRPADFPAPTITGMDQTDAGVVASWTSPRSYDYYFVEYTIEIPGQRAQTAWDTVSGGPGGSMRGSYTVSPLPPISATVLVRVTGVDNLLSGTVSSPPSDVGSCTVIGILHNPHISLAPKK